MNKLKYVQNWQIDRILNLIETQFTTQFKKYEILSKESYVNNMIKSKLIPEEAKSRRVQRQSVVLSSLLEPQPGSKCDFSAFL